MELWKYISSKKFKRPVDTDKLKYSTDIKNRC